MNQSNQADLGNGSIGKLLLKMAAPTIVAQVINMLYNMVDRMYIGHIPEVGSLALTGVGITFPIIMMISAFSSLIGMGGAPRAAISLGAGDKENANKILGNCVVSLAAVSVILTAVVLIFGKSMLRQFGATEGTTLEYGAAYLNIYALGTIFVQTVLGLNIFITTQGFSMTAMKTILIGAITNIIHDPILIFVFGMGVRGAALATIISQGISAVWVLRFLTGKKGVLRIQKKHLSFSLSVMLPVLALGLSPFIMQITESILTISFNASLQKFGGDLAVGAMTILAAVMQFAMMPIQGLTQGAQPIISFNFGAQKTDRVKKTFRLLLLYCVLFSGIIWAISMFAPKVFVLLFSNNLELTQISVWALRIYMAVSIIFGIQIACQQTFIALNQAGVSIFLAILRKVILLIPFIFILPHIIPDQFAAFFIPQHIQEILAGYDVPKVFSVFFAEPVSDTIAVTVTAFMFAFRFNKILKRGIPGNKEV